MDPQFQTLLIICGIGLIAFAFILIDIIIGDNRWVDSQLDETDKLSSLGKALEPYDHPNWTEFDDHAVQAMTLGNDVAPFEPRPAVTVYNPDRDGKQDPDPTVW